MELPCEDNLMQRQISALGRQRRGRVPRLVATGTQRRKEKPLEVIS
jgi:hypothetical protein